MNDEYMDEIGPAAELEQNRQRAPSQNLIHPSYVPNEQVTGKLTINLLSGLENVHITPLAVKKLVGVLIFV